MNQIEVVIKQNKDKTNMVGRDVFSCLKVNIPTEGEFMKRVLTYAEKTRLHLNKGQANTSENRNMSIVDIDNLSGLIAEAACEKILKLKYGEDKIIKPPNNTGNNQIDLMLNNGKTMEIRSSCVRNGLDFALFAADKENRRQQYFDVIGPYTNGYKKSESYKDYYMRVFYECDKRFFMSLLKLPYIALYITGGATKAMMMDEKIFQIKHLVPAGGQVQIESDYKVIPLARSLDINEFFEKLEKENDLKK